MLLLRHYKNIFLEHIITKIAFFIFLTVLSLQLTVLSAEQVARRLSSKGLKHMSVTKSEKKIKVNNMMGSQNDNKNYENRNIQMVYMVNILKIKQ